MNRKCAAIAKSTNGPCNKKAVPGSRYCLFHIEKTPLICGALIGVLLGYLFSWILPSPELTKLRRLHDDVKPIISLVETSFPSLERSKAIEKLMDQLQKEVETQKNTLRKLSSRLNLTFSGNWESKPYPAQLLSPVNEEYYIELNNNNQSIKFYASEVYKFRTLDDNRAEFRSLQAVKDGSFPLGQLIHTIESFSQINIHVPFFLGDRIEGGRITVEKIELAFAVNGIECNPLVVEKPYEIKLIKTGNTFWANIGIDIDPITAKELYQHKSRELKPKVNS